MVAPTPTPNPYADITIDADFCFNVSLHDPKYYRGRENYAAASYIQVECGRLAGRVIGERCNPSNANSLEPEAKTCIRRNAALIKDYMIRSTVYPQCFTAEIESDEQFFQCARETGDNDNRLRASLVDSRTAIRATVDQNQAVVNAEQNAWPCVEQAAENTPAPDYIDTSRLLFWQGWTSEADAKRLSELGSTWRSWINAPSRPTSTKHAMTPSWPNCDA